MEKSSERILVTVNGEILFDISDCHHLVRRL